MYGLFNKITDTTIFKGAAEPFIESLSLLSVESIELFGCETLVGVNNRLPDIALCFTSDSFRALAEWSRACGGSAPPGSFWSRIQDIADGNDNSLKHHLELVWVEMDARTCAGNSLQEPALFLELRPDFRDAQAVTEQVVPVLTGIRNHPASRTIEACISSLPDTGQLVHLGYFPSRSVETIRVTISFSRYRDLFFYCRNLLPADVCNRVEQRMIEIADCSDYGVLHLDIGAEIEPRLGIEIRFFEHEQNSDYQWRWHDIFALLTKRGVCTAREAEALLGFSGTHRCIDEHSFLPSWYRHFIYYLKGVFDFSGTERYKAYCAFKRLKPKRDI